MKRFLTLITLTLGTLSAFAYGYYDDSSSSTSGWLIFLSLILLVWGVLEIILFFKIWGMTEDVHNLRSVIVDDRSSKPVTKMSIDEIRDSVMRRFYLGKIDEAFDDLNLYTFKTLSEIGGEIYTDLDGKEYMYYSPDGIYQKKVYDFNEFMSTQFKEILDKVAPIYHAIGKEIPEQLKNINYDDMRTFGKPVEMKPE